MDSSIPVTKWLFSRRTGEALPDEGSPPPNEGPKARYFNDERTYPTDAQHLSQRERSLRKQGDDTYWLTQEVGRTQTGNPHLKDQARIEVGLSQPFSTSISNYRAPELGKIHTHFSPLTLTTQRLVSSHSMSDVPATIRPKRSAVETDKPHPETLLQKRIAVTEVPVKSLSNTGPPPSKRPKIKAESYCLETGLLSSRHFDISTSGIDFNTLAQRTGEADSRSTQVKNKSSRRRGLPHSNIFSFGIHSDSDTDTDSDIASIDEETSSESRPIDDDSLRTSMDKTEALKQIEVIDLTTPPRKVKDEAEY